ncbi:acyltransferase, partial [Cyanobacteria bacterium FACHB-63]|nr:acyltransferase [Cyanobacteria bacterium FACHB-63]
DYWRGIAALWVMLFHGFGMVYDKQLHPAAEVIKAIAAPGWLGVHFFFVISGYCIMSSAYRLTLKDGSPWTFLKNRFWRLVPTYWFAFFSVVVLNLASQPFNRASLEALVPLSWQAWVGNLLLIQPYMNVPFYVVVYWSLVVEIGFYLMMAVLLVIRNRLGQSVALFIGLSTAVASVVIKTQWAVLTSWCEFVCGALLFIALLSAAQGRVHHRHLALCLIAILGGLSLLINQTSHSSWAWFSAGFALLLYLLYPLDDRATSIRSLSWLSFVGLMSYSLYLMHAPLQFKVITLGNRFIQQSSLGFLALQILGWITAFAASYVFYCCVERSLSQHRSLSR